MMRAAFLAAAVMFPAAAFACDGEMKAQSSVKSVTVAQLAKDNQSRVFDANTKEFREKNGTIPGAVLLTSALSYDVKELPAQKDASVVFYCVSAKCSASHQAAERAVQAGYTNVSVMPDGLLGWKAAGQKTAALKPQS